MLLRFINPDLLLICATVWLCWTEFLILLWCMRKVRVSVKKGVSVHVGENNV